MSVTADTDDLRLSLLQSKVEYLAEEIDARRRCDTEAEEFARRQRKQAQAGLESLDEDSDAARKEAS